MSARREPTLADVAERAGVSLTTVSRVLNNRGYLSQGTKDKVARAIEELAYRPNQVARALHGMRTSSVGVIVPTLALPFFGELTAELEDILAEHGYRVLVCDSMRRADRERAYLDLLVAHRVDGIISSGHNDVAEYATVRLPLVTVDRHLSPDIPDVHCDNERGGRLATEHLLERGARCPVMLTSRPGAHNRREHAYRAACDRAGAPARVLAVHFDARDEERVALVAAELDAAAQSDVGLDGVFATDDLMAADAIEWARARGLRVPEDLKVVGFDGTSAIHRALPGLTTVRQPMRALASRAVDTLLALIEMRSSPTAEVASRGGQADRPPDSVVPVELLVGRSS